ncbi:hypothetical protein BIV08_24520 [Pseudomonas sp. AF76]|nr:hypothetical protein BIV08_24520 [Pseudomonas sp. AF76]
MKEANGPILNPVQAKDALHIVVPANAALLPDDKLKVTWTGAAGTPAGGSHTSGEWPVRDGWEVPIPNSVVAFNLGKSVTVTYTVIQNGVESPPSNPFVLNVQAMPVASLPIPLIPEAAQGGIGTELDLSKFTGDARVTVAPWPLIAVGQKVWLRCLGKKANGDDHLITLYAALGVTPAEVTAGLSKSLERLQLELLGNNTELMVELKVTLNGSGVEEEATVFPLRIYSFYKSLFFHCTTFTDNDPNGWGLNSGTPIINEDGNFYCRIDSSVSAANSITMFPFPVVSHARYKISLRARSNSPLSKLIVQQPQVANYVIWTDLAPHWQSYSAIFEFNLGGPSYLRLINDSDSSTYLPVDVDDICIQSL